MSPVLCFWFCCRLLALPACAGQVRTTQTEPALPEAPHPRPGTHSKTTGVAPCHTGKTAPLKCRPGPPVRWSRRRASLSPAPASNRSPVRPSRRSSTGMLASLTARRSSAHAQTESLAGHAQRCRPVQWNYDPGQLPPSMWAPTRTPHTALE